MELRRLNESANSDICAWKEMFNNDERITLQKGFVLTGTYIILLILFILASFRTNKENGLLSVIFSAWMSMTFLFTSLRYDKSYRNLANFTSVACIRRGVPLVVHLFLFGHVETLYALQTYSCELFGFLETFLAVLEVECLTHVCIERYVLAKYVTNGWQVKQKHYQLYICLCLFFACLYSVPPLFGVGRYNYDFQCTACTLDVILPSTWQKYIVLAIFVLRSMKPAAFMAFMLIWASVLEGKFPNTMRHHKHFTQSVIMITLVNLLCWTPIALIRMRVIVSQLMMAELLPMTSAYCVSWAMWVHWMAPTFTAIALFLVDDHVRYKMFNLHTSEYGTTETSDIKTD